MPDYTIRRQYPNARKKPKRVVSLEAVLRSSLLKTVVIRCAAFHVHGFCNSLLLIASRESTCSPLIDSCANTAITPKARKMLPTSRKRRSQVSGRCADARLRTRQACHAASLRHFRLAFQTNNLRGSYACCSD